MNTTSTDLYLEALADPKKLLPNDNNIIEITQLDENKESNKELDKEDNIDSFIIENSIESIHINDNNKDSNLEEISNDIKSSENIKVSEKLDNIYNKLKLENSLEKEKSKIQMVTDNNLIYKQTNNINSIDSNINYEKDTDNLNSKLKKMSIAEAKNLKFKKMECLTKLLNIKNSGIELTRNYNMNSDLEEMESELKYHTDLHTKKNGISLAKSFLCNCITGLEFLNEKYDPFGFKLSGWSEHIKSNKDEFDEVFGELIEKYKGNGKKMEPELKLVMLLIISAGSFHLTQSLSTNLPGIGDIIKTNPELLTKIQNNINKTIVGPSEYDKKKELYDNLKKIQANKEDNNKNNKNNSMNLKEKSSSSIKVEKSTSVKNLLKDIKKSIPLDTIADSCSITVGNTIHSDTVSPHQVFFTKNE